MSIALTVAGLVCLAYGIAMAFTYSAGGFYLIWLLLGGVLEAFAWSARSGVWTTLAAPLRLCISGLFAACVLAGFAGCAFILAQASAKAPDNLGYIVVLGASLNDDGSPKKTLRFRLDTAIDYLNANPSTRCIVSGGQGSDEPQTEASAMAAYLESAGIDPARITLEEKSTSTAENLEFSRKLIDAKDARVGIVTNNFHVYRAVEISRKLGYQQVWGLAAHTELQYLPQATLRECFAVLKDKLAGNM